MNEEILKFYQETTRKRGYPPFPLETASHFGIETEAAVEETKAVRAHIREITLTVELPKQCRPEVVAAEPASRQPPPAPAESDLSRFQGRNGWPNPRDRMIYWQIEARNAYVRGSVDYVLHDEQIALTPETEAWFYSADAARLPEYRRGTRGFLEQVVEETTKGCKTDRAKAMALVRLIGDTEKNPYRHRDPEWKPFLGGTEEEVLRKAWRMCNEISRVLNFLCTIAGIPARCMFLFTDPLTGVAGHAITEIFFDGKWNFVEQNLGLMFLMEDGYFASAVELRDRPEIVNSRADAGGGLCLSHASFTGPISILPYTIDKTDHYDYVWQANKPI